MAGQHLSLPAQFFNLRFKERINKISVRLSPYIQPVSNNFNGTFDFYHGKQEGFLVMPQLVPRALIFAGSSPDLVKYGQRHSRLAALATLQHWGVGGGGLFPVTAGLHFFKSFVLTPHMGMLVASSIINAAVTTITRAVTRILVLFLHILSFFFVYLSPRFFSLSLSQLYRDPLNVMSFLYSNRRAISRVFCVEN